MENPFEIINNRLEELENKIDKLIHKIDNPEDYTPTWLTTK